MKTSKNGKGSTEMQITQRVSLVAIVAVIIISTWFKPLDSNASQRIDTGLKNAAISFTAARTLNAAISVAQGTEVSIEPGGVGVNLTPGQNSPSYPRIDRTILHSNVGCLCGFRRSEDINYDWGLLAVIAGTYNCSPCLVLVLFQAASTSCVALQNVGNFIDDTLRHTDGNNRNRHVV